MYVCSTESETVDCSALEERTSQRINDLRLELRLEQFEPLAALVSCVRGSWFSLSSKPLAATEQAERILRD